MVTHASEDNASTPTTTSSACKGATIDLILLNLLHNVQEDDDKASYLVSLVRTSVLTSPVTAAPCPTDEHPPPSSSSSSSSSRELQQFPTRPNLHQATTEHREQEIERIQRQVLRYLQPKDKYAAFVSLLLKSQAYYNVLSTTSQGKEKEMTEPIANVQREVVDLPRTKHNQPYIPVLLRSDFGSISEKDVSSYFPFSVSHQHPFIGIAQLTHKISQQPLTTDNASTGYDIWTPRHVGMDLVVFDEYNSKLYSSQDEFLDVFQDSFAPSEWERIQQMKGQRDRLQEFYIRWSMKEAYTKALGMGMGVVFSSFAIALELDKNNYDCKSYDGTSGLLPSLRNVGSSGNVLHQRGLIEYKTKKEGECDYSKTEAWHFSFLPIYDDLSDPHGNSMEASVCVCAGPIPFSTNDDESIRVDLNIKWTDLNALIKFHQP